MTDADRKKLGELLKQMRSDCDHVRQSCEDIGCYGKPLENLVRSLLAEVEHWKRCCNEAEYLIENERLRADLSVEREARQRHRRASKLREARIDAALALHTQTDAHEGWDGYCMECSGQDVVEWPCATVKALKGGE